MLVTIGTKHGYTKYSVNKQTNKIFNVTPTGDRNCQLILVAHRKCFLKENKLSFYIFTNHYFGSTIHCPQKMSTKSINKKYPQKVSTKSVYNMSQHNISTKGVVKNLTQLHHLRSLNNCSIYVTNSYHVCISRQNLSNLSI